MPQKDESNDQGGSDAPASGKVYVTSWFGGVISVADLETGEIIRTVPVGVQDHNVFLSPDQQVAWMTNNNDGTVSIIDTSTDRVVNTVRTGNGPRHTFFSPDSSEAYVTNEFDDTVAVIDPVTLGEATLMYTATAWTKESTASRDGNLAPCS